MSPPVDPWLSRLKDAPYPVLGRCAEEIASLLTRDGVKNRQLSQTIAHDPLLCARLFRAVNRSPEGQLGTVEQAAALMGEEPFRALVTAGPLLEETLRGVALAAYAQALRRACHTAALARHLAGAQGYAHPQEFFYAGLLYRVGDLALGAADPHAARARDNGEAPGPDAAELSRALAREWHLPELLHRALSDSEEEDRKAILVRLAADLVDAGARDLHAPAQTKLLEETSVSADLGLPFMLRDVYQCAVATARDLLDWLPLDNRQGAFVPFYPGPYAWPAQSGTASRPSPTARPQPVPASPRKRPVSGQRIIEDTLTLIQAKLGLTRVVFATLSKDGQVIQARFLRGVDTDSPLRRFQFDGGGKSLFAQLLARPQHVWVHAGNREKLRPFLTMEVHRIVGERDFCASSIFVRSKPVGLCYADTYPAQDGLDEGTYHQFKGLCALTGKRLTELTARAPA
jgi:HD-like signal output (HDOD) protein